MIKQENSNLSTEVDDATTTKTTATHENSNKHDPHLANLLNSHHHHHNNNADEHDHHNHLQHASSFNNEDNMTPPPTRALEDPQFLFYVAASHGPALRATEVFVTKELFFRFFIESGVASAVSSYASKKKSGTTKKEKEDEATQKRLNSAGTSDQQQQRSVRNLMIGSNTPLGRLSSMRGLSTRGSIKGGGGTASTTGAPTTNLGATDGKDHDNTGTNDDTVDEIDEEIAARIPSCWATPPVSYAMLNRLWNENCSKDYLDIMFYPGFKSALDAMVARAQIIYEQHFYREQALRKKLLEQSAQEHMSFRISRPVFSASAVGGQKQQQRLARRGSTLSVTSNSQQQQQQQRSKKVVKIIPQHDENNTDDITNNSEIKLSAPSLIETVDSVEVSPRKEDSLLANSVTGAGAKPDSLSRQGSSINLGSSPSFDHHHHDHDHNHADLSSIDPTNANAQALKSKLHEIDEAKPNPQGGSDYLSSKLEVFTSNCCHDFTTATLTLQSLHNGSAGVGQTTTEVLLSSFVRHSPLLRLLFRVGIHIHHLREVRELAARVERDASNVQNVFSSSSSVGGGGGKNATGAPVSSVSTFRRNSLQSFSSPNTVLGSGTIFSSIPSLVSGTMMMSQIPSSATLPPGMMMRRGSSSTNTSVAANNYRPSNKSNKDMVQESIELLSASIFDVVAKSDDVRIEFLDRFERDNKTVTSETLVWLLSQAGASHSDHAMFLPEKGYAELLRLLRIYPSPVLGTEMLDTLFMTANHEDTKQLAKTNVLTSDTLNSLGFDASSRPLSPGTGNPLNAHQKSNRVNSSASQRDIFSSTTPRDETPNDPFLNPSAQTSFEFDEFIDFIFAIAVAIHGDRITYPKHVTTQAAVLNTLTLFEKCTAEFVIDPLARFTTHFAELVENTVAEQSMSPERHRDQDDDGQSPSSMSPPRGGGGGGGLDDTNTMMNDQTTSFLNATSSRNPDSTHQHLQLPQHASPTGSAVSIRSKQPAIVLRRNHFSVLHARSVSEFEATPSARKTADTIITDLLRPDPEILSQLENSPPDSMTNTYDSAGLARFVKVANMHPMSREADSRNHHSTRRLSTLPTTDHSMLSQPDSSSNNNIGGVRFNRIVSDQINAQNILQNEFDRNNHDLDVSGFNKKKIMMNINLEPTLRELSRTGLQKLREDENQKTAMNMTQKFGGLGGTTTMLLNPNNFGAITMKLLGGAKTDHDGNALLSCTMSLGNFTMNNNNNSNHQHSDGTAYFSGVMAMNQTLGMMNPSALQQNALAAAQQRRPHALFERGDDILVGVKYSVPPSNANVSSLLAVNQEGKRSRDILAASMFNNNANNNNNTMAMTTTMMNHNNNNEEMDDFDVEDEAENGFPHHISPFVTRPGTCDTVATLSDNGVKNGFLEQQQQQPEDPQVTMANMLVPEIWAVVPRVVKLTDKEPKLKNFASSTNAAASGDVNQMQQQHSSHFGYSPSPLEAQINSLGGGGSGTQQQPDSSLQQQNLENESTNIFISCWNMTAEPPSYSITAAMDELNLKRQRDNEMEQSKIAIEEKRKAEAAAAANNETQQKEKDERSQENNNRNSEDDNTTAKTGNAGGRARVVGFATAEKQQTADLKPYSSFTASVSKRKILMPPHQSVYGNIYEVDEEGNTTTDFSRPTLQAVLHFRMLVREFKTTKKDFSNNEEKDRWCQILRNIGSIETQNLFGKFDPRYVLDQAIANGVDGLKSFIKSQCNPLMFYSEDELVEMNFKTAVDKSRTSILLFGLKPGTIERDPFVKPLAVSALATRRNRLYCASLSTKAIRRNFNGSAFVNVICHPGSSKNMFETKKTGRDFIKSGESTGGLEDLPPLAVEFLQSLYLHCSWVYRLDVAGGKSASHEENSWLGTPQHCIAVECPPPKNQIRSAASSSKNVSSLDSSMIMPFSVQLKKAVYRFFARHGTKKRMALPLRPELPEDLSLLQLSEEEQAQLNASMSSKKKKKKSRRKSKSAVVGEGSSRMSNFSASTSATSRAASPGARSILSASTSSRPGKKSKKGKKNKKSGPPLEPTVIKPQRKPKEEETDFHWFLSRTNFMKWASKVFAQQGGCHVQIPLSELSLVQHRHIDKFAGTLADGSAFAGHTTVTLLELFDFFAASSGISEREVARWDFRFGKEIPNIEPADIIWPKTEAELAAEKEAEEQAKLLAKSSRRGGRSMILGKSGRGASSVRSNSSNKSGASSSNKSGKKSSKKGGKKKKGKKSPTIGDEIRPKHLPIPEKDTKGQINENDLSIVAQAFAWNHPFFTLEDGALLELPGPPTLRLDPTQVISSSSSFQPQQQQQQQQDNDKISSPSKKNGTGANTNTKGSVVAVSFTTEQQTPKNNLNDTGRPVFNSTSEAFSGSMSQQQQQQQQPYLIYPRLPEGYCFADEEDLALREIPDDKGLSAQAFLSLMSIVVAQLPSAIQTELEDEQDEGLFVKQDQNASAVSGEDQNENTTRYLSVRSNNNNKTSSSRKRSTTPRKNASAAKTTNNNQANNQANNDDAEQEAKKKKLPTVQVVCQRLQGLLDLDMNPTRNLRSRWVNQAAQVDKQLPDQVEPLLPKERYVPKPPVKQTIVQSGSLRMTNNINNNEMNTRLMTFTRGSNIDNKNNVTLTSGDRMMSMRNNANDADLESKYERAILEGHREASLNDLQITESVAISEPGGLGGNMSNASLTGFPTSTFLPAPPSKESIYYKKKPNSAATKTIIKEERTQGVVSFAGYRSQYKRNYPSNEDQLYASTLVKVPSRKLNNTNNNNNASVGNFSATSTGSGTVNNNNNSNFNGNNNFAITPRKGHLYPNGTVFPSHENDDDVTDDDDDDGITNNIEYLNKDDHLKFLQQKDDNHPEDLNEQIESKKRLKKDTRVVDARDPFVKRQDIPHYEQQHHDDGGGDDIAEDPVYDELFAAQRENVAAEISSDAILQHRRKRLSFESKTLQEEHKLGGPPSQVSRPFSSIKARQWKVEELARRAEQKKIQDANDALRRKQEEEERKKREEEEDQQQQQTQQYNESATKKKSGEDTGTEILSEYSIRMRKKIINDDDETNIVCEEPKWRDEGRTKNVEPIDRYDRGYYKLRATVEPAAGDTGAVSTQLADFSKKHKSEHFMQVTEERITSHLKNAVRVSHETEEASGALMPDGMKMREMKKKKQIQQQNGSSTTATSGWSQQQQQSNSLSSGQQQPNNMNKSWRGGGLSIRSNGSASMNNHRNNNNNNSGRRTSSARRK